MKCIESDDGTISVIFDKEQERNGLHAVHVECTGSSVNVWVDGVRTPVKRMPVKPSEIHTESAGQTEHTTLSKKKPEPPAPDLDGVGMIMKGKPKQNRSVIGRKAVNEPDILDYLILISAIVVIFLAFLFIFLSVVMN